MNVVTIAATVVNESTYGNAASVLLMSQPSKPLEIVITPTASACWRSDQIEIWTPVCSVPPNLHCM